MTITQRAFDKIGDLLEKEEESIREELSDKPEWVAQERINELWEAHELLYDAVNKVGIFDVEDEEEDDS